MGGKWLDDHLLDDRPEKTVLPLETGQHHEYDRGSLERRDETPARTRESS
jgi:hypothetical protein